MTNCNEEERMQLAENNRVRIYIIIQGVYVSDISCDYPVSGYPVLIGRNYKLALPSRT